MFLPGVDSYMFYMCAYAQTHTHDMAIEHMFTHRHTDSKR